jgi:hypothetical protein
MHSEWKHETNLKLFAFKKQCVEIQTVVDFQTQTLLSSSI